MSKYAPVKVHNVNVCSVHDKGKFVSPILANPKVQSVQGKGSFVRLSTNRPDVTAGCVEVGDEIAEGLRMSNVGIEMGRPTFFWFKPKVKCKSIVVAFHGFEAVRGIETMDQFSRISHVFFQKDHHFHYEETVVMARDDGAFLFSIRVPEGYPATSNISAKRSGNFLFSDRYFADQLPNDGLGMPVADNFYWTSYNLSIYCGDHGVTTFGDERLPKGEAFLRFIPLNVYWEGRKMNCLLIKANAVKMRNEHKKCDFDVTVELPSVLYTFAGQQLRADFGKVYLDKIMECKDLVESFRLEFTIVNRVEKKKITCIEVGLDQHVEFASLTQKYGISRIWTERLLHHLHAPKKPLEDSPSFPIGQTTEPVTVCINIPATLRYVSETRSGFEGKVRHFLNVRIRVRGGSDLIIRHPIYVRTCVSVGKGDPLAPAMDVPRLFTLCNDCTTFEAPSSLSII